MPRLRDRIIRQVPDVPTPTIMRGRLIHGLIKQLNANTIAINSPRQVTEDFANDALGLTYANNRNRETNVNGEKAETLLGNIGTGPYVVHAEFRRQTSTVRVENPDDPEQYVDVERIDRVLFLGSDGSVNELVFFNS